MSLTDDLFKDLGKPKGIVDTMFEGIGVPEEPTGTTTIRRQGIIRSMSLSEPDFGFSETPEFLFSEETQEAVVRGVKHTFAPSLSPGAVLPLGEATAFFDDIAERTTGLATDPMRNFRALTNLGFMASPATAIFPLITVAQEALRGKEKPLLTKADIDDLVNPSK